jgi:hypothetical protein
VAGVLFQHVSIPSPYLVGAGLCGLALVVVLGQPSVKRPSTAPLGASVTD